MKSLSSFIFSSTEPLASDTICVWEGGTEVQKEGRSNGGRKKRMKREKAGRERLKL